MKPGLVHASLGQGPLDRRSSNDLPNRLVLPEAAESERGRPMLKIVAVIIVGIAVMCPIVASAETGTFDVAKAAREGLSSLFNNTGKQAILDSIEVKPVIENEVQEDGRWFSAIRFDVYIEEANEKRFQAGAVGTGTTQEQSRKEALTIWLRAFATAFEKALVQAPERKSISGYFVSPGVAMARGQMPESCWLISNDAIERMVSIFRPFLGKFKPKELVVLLLTIFVDDAGNVDGECRINGDRKEEIEALLQKTDLPKRKDISV